MRAIVFDLDGTLIDSAPDLHAALNFVLRLEDRRPVSLETAQPMIGGGAVKMITEGFAVTGDPVTEAQMTKLHKAFLEFYEAECHHRSKPYPRVFEVLEQLRGDGYKLGVCTNKLGYLTDKVLAGFKMTGYFDSIAGADRFTTRKPDAGHLLGVLDELGVAAEDAVMVGDSETDVATARATGCPVIAVTFGYPTLPPDQLGADALISHYNELPGAINALR
ncbi:MAG: HAD-IA family hydrolase [Proteobacteria bacterium]|nr:HAD-IA family hydrolase [Pseudomonadota bacterium]